MKWTMLLMMTALLSPFGIVAETRTLPSLLHPRDTTQKYPVWVAAREAFDQHGRLKTSHFSNAGPQFLDPREPGGKLVDGSWTVFWDLATKDCTSGVGGIIIQCGGSVPSGEIKDRSFDQIVETIQEITAN